jgi:hypothetical protein
MDTVRGCAVMGVVAVMSAALGGWAGDTPVPDDLPAGSAVLVVPQTLEMCPCEEPDVPGEVLPSPPAGGQAETPCPLDSPIPMMTITLTPRPPEPEAPQSPSPVPSPVTLSPGPPIGVSPMVPAGGSRAVPWREQPGVVRSPAALVGPRSADGVPVVVREQRAGELAATGAVGRLAGMGLAALIFMGLGAVGMLVAVRRSGRH